MWAGRQRPAKGEEATETWGMFSPGRRPGAGLLTKWLLHICNSHPSVQHCLCWPGTLGCAGAQKQEHLVWCKGVGAWAWESIWNWAVLVLLCREQITHAAWNAFFYPNMCTSEVKKISGMCGSTCWQKDIDFAEAEVNGRKIKGQRAQTWIIFFSCMSVTKASTTYSFLLHKDFTLILNISQ